MSNYNQKYIYSDGASIDDIYRIDPQDIGGSIQLMEYLDGTDPDFTHKPGENDNSGLTNYYIYNNKLDELINHHSSGKAIYDSEMFNYAAQYGYIDMIEWLHNNSNVPFTEEAIDRAVEGGHLDVVQFLCENRNEGFTYKAFENAILHKRPIIHKYLINYSKLCKYNSD